MKISPTGQCLMLKTTAEIQIIFMEGAGVFTPPTIPGNFVTYPFVQVDVYVRHDGKV